MTATTNFNPQQLKEACMTALETWDFNPENHREKWGEMAEEFMHEYKLVLEIIYETPADFLDESTRKLVENDFSNGDIWEYLTACCQSFASFMLKGF